MRKLTYLRSSLGKRKATDSASDGESKAPSGAKQNSFPYQFATGSEPRIGMEATELGGAKRDGHAVSLVGDKFGLDGDQNL